MSEFADIFASATETAALVMGVEVLYVTAAGVTAGPFTVTPGRTEFALDDGGGGVTINFQSRDYLIPASLLVDATGTPITLTRGDQIRETASGLVYQVMLEKGIPAWAWSDTLRTVYRIHTKEVSGGVTVWDEGIEDDNTSLSLVLGFSQSVTAWPTPSRVQIFDQSTQQWVGASAISNGIPGKTLYFIINRGSAAIASGKAKWRILTASDVVFAAGTLELPAQGEAEVF